MTLSKTNWPENSKELALELHSLLSIRDQNWHQLKNNHERRAAELISGAIIQLLSNGCPNDIEALLEQGILWIKKEINDPGCPHR